MRATFHTFALFRFPTLPLPRVLTLSLLLLPTLGLSCRDDTRAVMAPFDAPAGPPKSLPETVAHLRASYSRKAYLALRPYVDPEGRDQLIDLLLAVDSLQAANGAALGAVQRVCPDAPREQLDISPIADTLELFSRHVQVVSAQEDRAAGRGTVLLRTSDRPPPVPVNFRLRDGHWVYIPGQHLEELTLAFRDLAKSLDQVTRCLADKGRMTPRQVEYQYELFVVPTWNRMSQTLAAR
jgi:hypothetical protein